MTNLFEQAINCENGNRAAKIIQDALGIENADLVKWSFKAWPADREQRARIIGEWLQMEARLLADTRSGEMAGPQRLRTAVPDEHQLAASLWKKKGAGIGHKRHLVSELSLGLLPLLSSEPSISGRSRISSR